MRLLEKHTGVDIKTVTSESSKGKKVKELFPALKLNNVFETADISKISSSSDLVFLCLPYTKSMEVCKTLLDGGCKVIDLSADYRVKDIILYKEYYKTDHIDILNLKQSVYGLPELNREKIKRAKLTANPGCFPTGIILGAAPLLEKKLVDLSDIIINSITGVSGAGKKPKQDNLFSEISGSVKAYKAGVHQHIPEMEQEMSSLAGGKVRILFTPHLVPINRGIFSTMVFRLKKKHSGGDIAGLFGKFYSKEKFVKVYPEGNIPEIKSVFGSNECHIGIKLDERTGRLFVFSAIDNLTKGASGQAVQNMNLMLGFAEDTALTSLGMLP
jgi:N-acetyl-gamma-glutamyl-phosphate reductase